MFKRYAKWNREWELETIAVLRDPAHAATLAPGYRRWVAERLAQLSEIERRQFLAFCERWTGMRFTLLVLAIVAVLAAIGLGLHGLRPDKPLVVCIVMVEGIGLVLAMTAFSMWFNYRRFMRRPIRSAAVLVTGGMVGAIAGLSGMALGGGRPVLEVLARDGPPMLRLLASGLAVLILVGLVVAISRNAGYEKLAVQLRAQAEQERLARQLTESQLRLLHAQIEPHFLFNTLGAVQQLAEREQAREAARLTANLIAFLRATAGGMTRESATLHEEFELARAYLGVMKARLGERLTVTIDLPADLAAVRLPGMAVLTLAENAIKHGAEPARGPVRITLWAAREDGRVLVRVSDTGAGLSDTPAGGMGLRNLRDRLRLAFGPAAALGLHEQDAGGVVAEIALPSTDEVAA